jgi:primosomal protein N' (replication factor Y)
MNCTSCSAWLVEHRFKNRLECHHCGYNRHKPDSCPECGEEDAMVACGPGVERLYEEVIDFLPDANVELITSETLQGPVAAAAFVARIISGESNLIIGTQIVAKGYHFPNLTLVGAVDADLGLDGGDLRAGERTYQLLHQVAGRAGRAAHKGRVILQTSNPDAPVLQALVKGDRDGFLDILAHERELGGWPPYGRLAALVLAGADEHVLDQFAMHLARCAPHGTGLVVLGPAPAPLALLRGRHRRRFLIKSTKDLSMQKILSDWLGRIKTPSSVRLSIDIDPYSFL